MTCSRFLSWRAGRMVITAVALVLLLGCGSERPYVWVQSLPAQQAADAPIIRAGDHLDILVRGHEGERDTVVGKDGTIVHVLAGRVPVAGLTSDQAAERMARALRSSIVDARVIIAITASAPARVSVVGEVEEAGTYEIEPGEGVLDALARAGGLTPFADDTAIYVLRKEPNEKEPTRVRFRYDDLTGGQAASAAFVLRHGDVVVVD